MIKPSIILVVAVSALASSSASAARACNPQVESNIKAGQAAAVAQDASDAAAPLHDLQQSPVTSASSGAFGCVSSVWPTINSGFHLPTMDQIIRGVVTTAVQKACTAARNEIASATSGINASTQQVATQVNNVTSSIPGIPPIVSSSGSTTSVVGATTSSAQTGTSAPVTSGWNTIRSLF
ncbi:hypothetical protein [Burkholderia vietnamiensis]|uniref:hypothetical protein n=1 Tax=Burkholderia vietnamiensis TaxID=60552 RepID=UPI001BA30A4E|nr:hypothetical protein [Burkholderia vietnamiensis]MBR8000421.1 hypothetical protein [Burkholderia vietnamiensis]MCA8451559.1 hypothetical protein [Burkholderia vietnamiensis]HDR8954170.1 hypothetical protein [Burkholderia vietnamiensis]